MLSSFEGSLVRKRLKVVGLRSNKTYRTSCVFKRNLEFVVFKSVARENRQFWRSVWSKKSSGCSKGRSSAK